MSMRLVSCWLLFVGAWLLCSATQADDPPQQPEIEYRVAQVSAGSGGLYSYVPGEWGLIRLQLTNHQDVAVELDCSTYFDSEQTLQYGRRVWMPPRSMLWTSHPILLPAQPDVNDRRIPFHTILSSADIGTVHDEIGNAQYESDLVVERDTPVSGMVVPQGEETLGDEGISPMDIMTAGRLELYLSRDLAYIGDRTLPASEIGLAAIDQLMIADDRFLNDAAAVSAIRHWLYGGGYLWVMLDRVDPEVLSAIMGDESGCHVVDDVTLNSLHITSTRATGGFGDIHAEYEAPLKLVRVLVDDETVIARVNDWPAAFWKECGEGRLIVTTLQTDAWAEKVDGSHRLNSAMQHVMSYYFPEQSEKSTVAEVLEPRLRELVGYTIPGKGPIIGLFSVFIAMLGGGGYWLLRTGRLERLVLLTPIVAIAVAGLLILIGRQHRQAVPPSTAKLQVVQPIPGTDDVRIVGSAGLYAPGDETSVLGGSQGGWIAPLLDGTENTIRRMMWDDLGQWSWEDLPQPPGLRPAEFQVSLQTPERVSARGELSSEGISGALTTLEGLPPQDAILATRNGRIAVDIQDDGTFTAASNQVLGVDEFLRAGILSDEQSLRGRALADLLQNSEATELVEPTLMYWTDPWEGGLRYSDETVETGSALVVVPVQLRRPAAGTAITIPSPLIAFREAIGPDGYAPSGLYDARKYQWQKKSRPTITWMRFQIPAGLAPLEYTSGRFEIAVTGPMGKFALSTYRNEEVVPFETWMDPVGTLRWEMDAEVLEQIAAGDEIMLRVEAGDPSRPELTAPDPETGKVSYWNIESMTLELEAIVLDDEPSAEQQ